MRPKLPIRVNSFIKIMDLKQVVENGELYAEMQISINKQHPLFFVYLSREAIRYIWRLTLQTIKGG